MLDSIPAIALVTAVVAYLTFLATFFFAWLPNGILAWRQVRKRGGEERKADIEAGHGSTNGPAISRPITTIAVGAPHYIAATDNGSVISCYGTTIITMTSTTTSAPSSSATPTPSILATSLAAPAPSSSSATPAPALSSSSSAARISSFASRSAPASPHFRHPVSSSRAYGSRSARAPTTSPSVSSATALRRRIGFHAEDGGKDGMEEGKEQDKEK